MKIKKKKGSMKLFKRKKVLSFFSIRQTFYCWQLISAKLTNFEMKKKRVFLFFFSVWCIFIDVKMIIDYYLCSNIDTNHTVIRFRT